VRLANPLIEATATDAQVIDRITPGNLSGIQHHTTAIAGSSISWTGEPYGYGLAYSKNYDYRTAEVTDNWGYKQNIGFAKLTVYGWMDFPSM
jgi:hypothetical protein